MICFGAIGRRRVLVELGQLGAQLRSAVLLAEIPRVGAAPTGREDLRCSRPDFATFVFRRKELVFSRNEFM